jgi:hypothetical protein
MPSLRGSTIAFAGGRLAFGVGLIAAPGRTASGWLGSDARRAPTQVAVRGLGARDIALSAGVAAGALERGALRPWLAACVACDLSDIAATVAAGDSLSSRARWGTIALAGAAAVAGLALIAGAEG